MVSCFSAYGCYGSGWLSVRAREDIEDTDSRDGVSELILLPKVIATWPNVLKTSRNGGSTIFDDIPK